MADGIEYGAVSGVSFPWRWRPASGLAIDLAKQTQFVRGGLVRACLRRYAAGVLQAEKTNPIWPLRRGVVAPNKPNSCVSGRKTRSNAITKPIRSRCACQGPPAGPRNRHRTITPYGATTNKPIGAHRYGAKCTKQSQFPRFAARNGGHRRPYRQIGRQVPMSVGPMWRTAGGCV